MPSMDYAAPSIKGRNLIDNSKLRKNLNGIGQYVSFSASKLETLLQKKYDPIIIHILKEKYKDLPISILVKKTESSTTAKEILKEKLVLQSIRDIARYAKEYNNLVAVEVLREKYNTNELRLAVKTALNDLSEVYGKKEISELAKSNLNEIEAIEKRRKENVNLNFNSKSFTTVAELTRKPKVEANKNNKSKNSTKKIIERRATDKKKK